MSTWHALAIERLGAPNVLWPSVYGPAAGTDPVSANGLRTLDLTPFLEPLADFGAQMERDLTTGSFSSIKLNLMDWDGTLADALGPFSATLATPTRFYGSWVQILERWGEDNEALRFLGYIDETSIQWTEQTHQTQCTILHASQLLRERLITDYPALLRPWPSVPTNATQDFVQSTADDLLHAAVPAYSVRSGAAALESGLWALGQLTWIADISSQTISRELEGPDLRFGARSLRDDYPPPAAPASSLVIGGAAYAIDHLEWDTSISAEVVTGDPDANGTTSTYNPVRVYLQGAPNLSSLLHLGDTVTWGIPESQRTHYLLNGSSIAPPASGSDGPKFVPLNTVEQLAPGDVLTLTFSDATSGTPRTTTAELPVIIDMDGETGKVFLATALSQGYSNVSKVRRNSQDPVLFDGLTFAKALCAPFGLTTQDFVPAPTDTPVLVFQPYDVAAPPLYGAHHLQTVNQTGGLLVARRGADNGLGAFPTAGVWAGSWGGTWAWLGLPSASATHQIYGDVLQFPGGVNAYSAPVLYIEGDLSGGATTPPNGWRHAWRTWRDLNHVTQDPESTWSGSAVDWAPHAASGDIPAKLVAFAASTPTPGRYTRTAAGVWTFEAHTGNATLGAGGVPAISGAVPAGNWLALGMGIRANGDEEEALLGLVATGAGFPFTEIKAVLLSQAAGGDLTLRQVQSLWATGAAPAGAWALGGGLVVQSYSQTIDGLVYPHTTLYRLNGGAVLSVDLKTLEVIPQTIQPLLKIGSAGAQVIGGWYALALETYADSNYAASRRLRFLHFDQTLTLVNGTPEADPSTPTSVAAYFPRGEMVASIVPDGALIAKMVRISNTKNAMAGIIGGRIFTVGSELPTTVERLKIGATVPKGNTLDISRSGDGMSAAGYLENFATTQLASFVPSADGGMSLVSKSGGTVRVRPFGAQRASVLPAERGRCTKTQVWEGYVRKVRVTYTDILANATASIEVAGAFDGGRIYELDVSDMICSETMSWALGRAAIYWFVPAALLSETWEDLTGGVSGDMTPAWWFGWKVGDRIIRESYTPGDQVTAWKLLKMQPNPESRKVAVELRQQPFQIVGPA